MGGGGARARGGCWAHIFVQDRVDGGRLGKPNPPESPGHGGAVCRMLCLFRRSRTGGVLSRAGEERLPLVNVSCKHRRNGVVSLSSNQRSVSHLTIHPSSWPGRHAVGRPGMRGILRPRPCSHTHRMDRGVDHTLRPGMGFGIGATIDLLSGLAGGHTGELRPPPVRTRQRRASAWITVAAWG